MFVNRKEKEKEKKRNINTSSSVIHISAKIS